MSTRHKVLEKCKDIELVFSGGQRKVYKANHIEYGPVAVKIGKFNSPNSLERIRREVACLQSIESPYFAKNYELIVDNNEKVFITIEEYIEGRKLNEIKELKNNEIELVRMLKKLINGLKVLWEKNIVHRDLKPDNILVKNNMEPIIIDLGIARFLDYEGLTKTILPMGPCTPIYASPEQILNKKHIIDMRSDFYALGLIILELFLGVHPFDPKVVGNDNDIPINICKGIYFLPTDCQKANDKFVHMIKKMLDVQPYRRFRNYQMLEEYIKENWGDI